MINLEMENVLPVIILNEIVAVPGSIVHFVLTNGRDYNAALSAFSNKTKILVIHNLDNVIPDIDDGRRIVAVLADVNQIVRDSKQSMRVLINACNRVYIDEFDVLNNMITAAYSEIGEAGEIGTCDHKGLILELKDVVGAYEAECENLNHKLTEGIDNIKNASDAVDFVLANAPLAIYDKMEIINIPGILNRCDRLLEMLVEDVDAFRLKKTLHERVTARLDRHQREFYLREKLAEIKMELGDDSSGKVESFKEQAEDLDAAQTVKDHIMEEINHFEEVMGNTQEATVIRGYIELLLSLPWNKKSGENNDINNVLAVLERDHYGMEDVKERIIENLAVRALNHDCDSPIICLVGPPGTGKTSVAKSVAEALSRKYVRICLGGVRDEAEIRGHRKTYVGAMPGRLINALKKAKVANPLILLDEIDKVSSDYKGDVHSALLEVLDPEQNEFFTDHYVEIPVNLSDVLFICTANTTETIPQPLLDRMEIINVSGYTGNEKFHIATKHLVPRQIKKSGLTKSKLNISDEAVKDIILYYTREAGVRGLEKCIGKICRKTAKNIVSGSKKTAKVTSRNLKDYLGKKIYRNDEIPADNEIGVVTGLAWTSCGGETLEIEVNIMKGKGKCEFTGQMGDVMKESAMTAMSYVRSLCVKYEFEADYFDNHDIHIHIPEGAVPKDGPSAGITMATAILSAVTERAVYANVAMTGEITLRGRVLPIGGLKEKLLAAKNSGVTKVLVPLKNKSDVYEISSEITEGLNIIYVSHMDEVISNALV